MKKFLFFLLALLVPVLTNAATVVTKSQACIKRDGLYNQSISIVYEASSAGVRNYIKSGNMLYYIVNSTTGTNSSQELYLYDCVKKKASLLANLTLYSTASEAEIDYFNARSVFVRYINTDVMTDEEVIVGEGIYDRKNAWYGEFTFSNHVMIDSQWAQDFGPISDIPYKIIDVTTGKDKKLLVWITWGDQMQRALSVDPTTFRASNVLYDYQMRKSDGSAAGLKVTAGKLYEKNNVNKWVVVSGIDLSTFRAVEGSYGRDKKRYTLYQAEAILPIDAYNINYHIFYSPSERKLFSYHLGDWKSINLFSVDTFYHHDYFTFDNPHASCINTTDSYGYIAEDAKYCYGDIGGSKADFGIVGEK